MAGNDERAAVLTELGANGKRRERANAEVTAARDELHELLVRGQAAGLDVSGMSRTAGVSRETAHKLLRNAEPVLGHGGLSKQAARNRAVVQGASRAAQGRRPGA
jgi:hypothetical protein